MPKEPPSSRFSDELSSLRHDLAGIIAPIKTTAELALLGVGDLRKNFSPENLDILAEDLESVSRGCSRLYEFIEAHLYSSSDRAGRTNIEAVVSSRIKMLSLYRNSGMHFSTDIQTQRRALIPPSYVSRILENLFSNAIRAMPNGGRIHLEAKDEEEYIHVTCSDTGPGVPLHQAENIFSPDFSLHSKGLGFGLPAARSIADSYGGSLSLDTTYTGGARFLLSLPAAQKRAILVVDDDAQSRSLLGSLCKRNGYEPILAKDGREGFTFFNKFAPDVIVTDCMMPYVTGDDMLKQIRAQGGVAPVISVSNNLVSAVDCSLPKPVDPKEFIEALHHYAPLIGETL